MEVQHMYLSHNERSKDDYKKSLVTISGIFDETKNEAEKNQYARFFNNASSLVLKLAEIEDRGESYFNNDFDTLKEDNQNLFEELLPQNYATSFANPAYAVWVFGEDYGQLMSYLYSMLRGNIKDTFKHKIYKFNENNQLLIKVYQYIKDSKTDYISLKEMIIKTETENKVRDHEVSLFENYSKDNSNFNNIILNSDLSDLRYLFKFGLPISESQVKYAQFLNSFSDEKIKGLSKTIVEAFLEGFVRKNKDRGDRNVVRIEYTIGEERIIKQIIEDFKIYGIKVTVFMPNPIGKDNQFKYDHKNDKALYLDQQYNQMDKSAYAQAMKNCEGFLKEYCGVVCIESFGEKPFTPIEKKENLELSAEQAELNSDNSVFSLLELEKYIPAANRSFNITAFPSPEIGDRFEEIYDDIVKINTLDSKRYEVIHNTIIRELDKGEYVWVKGANGNKTDIKVKMQELNDPENETNFYNSLANVNISLGEVFTSPKLCGTNGLLHAKSVYLKGYLYKDLIITFKDGMIADFSCKNFENEEDNKKYIQKNLLQRRNTLPMGEFAIGTNTVAYVTANKHNIMDILPILIIEKMGPHFAVGDTCYHNAEDVPVFSGGKRMIAVENEVSQKRHTNPQQAYTKVHTDITLPYSDLGFIKVITKDNQFIDIIKDGKFVLEGTEELNAPLEELESQ